MKVDTGQLTLSEQVAYFKEQESIRYDLQDLLEMYLSEADTIVMAALIMDNFHLEKKNAR